MAAPVEKARVEVHKLGPDTLADVVRLLVLDLAREELGRIATSLNGRPPPSADVDVLGLHEPQEPTRALGEGSHPPRAAKATRRRCSACGEEKAARVFEKGRGQCRTCRHAAARRRYNDRQARARDAQANAAEPEEPG